MKIFLTLAITATAISQAFAINLVTNGDFETNSYPVGNWVSATPTGWTALAPGDVAGIGFGYLSAPSQELDVSGGTDVAGSGITQMLATVAGQSYTISFDVFTGYGYNLSGGVDAEIGATTLGLALQGSNTGNGRQTYTFNHTALANNEAITFRNAGRGVVAHVDNVQAVPEPGSYLALAFGAVSLISRRLRRN